MVRALKPTKPKKDSRNLIQVRQAYAFKTNNIAQRKIATVKEEESNSDLQVLLSNVPSNEANSRQNLNSDSTIEPSQCSKLTKEESDRDN